MEAIIGMFSYNVKVGVLKKIENPWKSTRTELEKRTIESVIDTGLSRTDEYPTWSIVKNNFIISQVRATPIPLVVLFSFCLRISQTIFYLFLSPFTTVILSQPVSKWSPSSTSFSTPVSISSSSLWLFNHAVYYWTDHGSIFSLCFGIKEMRKKSDTFWYFLYVWTLNVSNN